MKESNSKVLLDSFIMFVVVFVMIVIGIAIVLNGHNWLKSLVKVILSLRGVHL